MYSELTAHAHRATAVSFGVQSFDALFVYKLHVAYNDVLRQLLKERRSHVTTFWTKNLSRFTILFVLIFFQSFSIGNSDNLMVRATLYSDLYHHGSQLLCLTCGVPFRSVLTFHF